MESARDELSVTHTVWLSRGPGVVRWWHWAEGMDSPGHSGEAGGIRFWEKGALPVGAPCARLCVSGCAGT